ncbi:IS1595 family transposase [Sphingomonas sp. MS122]|uniref:IS1595 family transposase n=1 Tax=Sphingomonas sp. MS122 TaxID=3412683 RepID=UPI003C2F61F3
MSSTLSAPHFHNEEAAYAYVEARIWPEGPICPHCGGVERVGKLQGKSTRVGVWKCYQCRKPFTVKIGTIFEDSKVAMHIWLQAMYLVAGSKKGISSNQLHRILGVTLKTAWFMSHRIREAMRDTNMDMFGGEGGAVQADETYIGNKQGAQRAKGGFRHKMKVVALLDQRTGRARAIHADAMVPNEVANIVRANVDRESVLVTDEARHYWRVGKEFADHRKVFHGAGIYAKDGFSTNAIEGYFSIFKRGMRGVYQFCSEKHLHRYLAEFDFRYGHRVVLGYNDADRADALLSGIVGKRLTYETIGARA